MPDGVCNCARLINCKSSIGAGDFVNVLSCAWIFLCLESGQVLSVVVETTMAISLLVPH